MCRLTNVVWWFFKILGVLLYKEPWEVDRNRFGDVLKFSPGTVAKMNRTGTSTDFLMGEVL